MASAAAAPSGSWWSRALDFSGDVRLRYETIDVDGGTDRERGRVRGRLDVTATANDALAVVFRVATNDGSPVSDNLTLGNGFSVGDVGLVRAYLDWRPSAALRVKAGRMEMPWYRAGGNSLLWDSDLDPEGVAVSYDAGARFGSVAVISVADRPGEDALLASVQGGFRAGVGQAGTLTAGAGFYDYSKTAGYRPFYDGLPDGNSVDASGRLLHEYSLAEVFADYRISLGELPFTVFGEWVRNVEIDEGDTAYALGIRLGDAQQRGDVELGYAWHDTGADAVVATFNDSDFAGGDTNARGHYIEAGVLVTERIALGATIIAAKLDEGIELDYDRVMLDLEWNFE